MEQNYCLIDQTTNTVINIIYWDGNLEQWQPPENTVAIQSNTAGIGWKYDFANQSFINPSIPVVNTNISNTKGPNVIIN